MACMQESWNQYFQLEQCCKAFLRFSADLSPHVFSHGKFTSTILLVICAISALFIGYGK
jgi:hypothetical protein